MKIGICASTFSKKGFGRFGENTYNKLKEFGFSATDFGMMDTDSVIYTANRRESDALLIRERELANKASMEIFQVHGPWRYPPQDFTKEDRAERIEKMKFSIYAASVLGAKNWVIHPLMPFGIDDIETFHEKETREINAEFLTDLLRTAKKYSIIICLENMPFRNFSLSSPEKVLDIVNAVNDDNLRICLDTGHVNVLGLDLAEEVYRIKDKLQVLHVHDNFGNDSHFLPYIGNINWIKFGKALKDVGFNGVFSLETSPPKLLPDELFEKASKLVCDTVKYIIK
ncbi:MAG: sugar phosphate isomerase/epimerase [Clostridia bacterium]|nr:sugar phosphate isomerase/epimerase [Clostridia bacterium]